VSVRRKDDLEMFHEHGIYVAKRHLVLMGEIDEQSVKQVCINLTMLELNGTGPITLLLNTPGGSVYDGLALYDTIKACDNEVSIIAAGHIMSMGMVILQAADRRILTPNCRIMMHHGGTGYDGNSADFEAAAADTKALRLRTNKILLKKIEEKKPNYTAQQLNQMLLVDTYMWPEKAVAMGLADEVMGEED